MTKNRTWRSKMATVLAFENAWKHLFTRDISVAHRSSKRILKKKIRTTYPWHCHPCFTWNQHIRRKIVKQCDVVNFLSIHNDLLYLVLINVTPIMQCELGIHYENLWNAKSSEIRLSFGIAVTYTKCKCGKWNCK